MVSNRSGCFISLAREYTILVQGPIIIVSATKIPQATNDDDSMNVQWFKKEIVGSFCVASLSG